MVDDVGTGEPSRRREAPATVTAADDGFSVSGSSDVTDVTDACTPSTSPSHGNTLNSLFEPSVSHVSEKLVAKIRMGKLVDVGKLLRKDGVGEESGVLTLTDGKIEVAEQAVVITSFYKWFDAFIVYMSIRGRYYPAELQGMLRHMELVKQVFHSGMDGASYDYLFRARKADFPSIPWGQYMPELARTQKPQSKSKSQQGPGKQTYTKTGRNQNQCNFFNFGKCSRKACPYAHTCFACKRPDHGVMNCAKRSHLATATGKH